MDSLDALVLGWDEKALPFLEESLSESIKEFKQLQQLKNKNLLDFGKKVVDINALFAKVKEDVDNYLDVEEGISLPLIMPYSFFPPRLGVLTKMEYLLSMACFADGGLLLQVDEPFFSVPLFTFGLGVLYAAISSHSEDIEHGNMYKPADESITIRKASRVRTQLTLVHEYVHHIQNIYSLFVSKDKKDEIFNEGHARGVARNLSKKYVEVEDNHAFRYSTLEFFVPELRSFYLWICSRKGIAPRKSLVKSSRLRIDKVEDCYRKKSGLPSPHAMGNIIFYYFEQSFGDNLYKDFLLMDLFNCSKINGDAEI